MFEQTVDAIRWWASVTPEKVALVDLGRSERLTYDDLDKTAGRWATLLAARGVGPGDRVAVLAGNRADIVAMYYGCGRIGAALVPLNWRLAPTELAKVVADARPRVLVGEARFAAMASASAEAAFIDIDRDAPSALAAVVPAAMTSEPVRPDAPAMILYTSGSTGKPKGAILTQRQVLANAIATAIGWQLSAADTAPVSTPFFHTGGWHVFSTVLWQLGGTIVLVPQFDPATFHSTLRDEGCTVAFGVPTQLVMLSEATAFGMALPKLRFIACGGAPCPAQLATRIRSAGYTLRLGFGMTEFGPNCFATSDAMALAKPESVGWPMPFVEMRVVDERDHVLGNDEVGELQLKGPQLFAGYLDDPERTREAMTADGWLRTGDLASRDADGAWTIRGRRKDMFISGGENVFPGEVEAALADCEGVAESVVVGVPHERWGEVGHAYVQPRGGAVLSGDVILARLRETLAHYKVPKSIEVVAELPRIGSGKVDRIALKRAAQEIVR
jgi:fatty-acyl-CoA synthase